MKPEPLNHHVYRGVELFHYSFPSITVEYSMFSSFVRHIYEAIVLMEEFISVLPVEYSTLKKTSFIFRHLSHLKNLNNILKNVMAFK